MMKKWSVVLIAILSLLAIGFPSAAQTELRQWATRATATTEYTATDWSAERATGPPNAMISCADHVQAWASLEVSDGEALTVYFDTPVEPTQVNIYQNFNPGAISSIELIPEDGDFTIPVANSADTNTSCPGIFSVDVILSTHIIGVVINLDQVAIGDWNEIDAVELVGMASGNGVVAPGPGGTSNSGPGGGSSNTTATTVAPTAVPQNNGGDGGYVAPDGPAGIDITCPDGRQISNGIKVTVVQMRTGFNYTATAVGMNGFDPVLAVLDPRGRAALCNDDFRDAANYSADLPTTGFVPASSTTSQVTFSNNGSGFSDVSLVVGGFNAGDEGEFVLILEGMAYTDLDGAGDPFAMEITPGMIASGVDPTVYMISVRDRLDPYVSVVDADGNHIFDEKGNQTWYCDDAGSVACYGESYSMEGSYVSRTANRYLGGYGLDAMLTFPLGAGDEWFVVNTLMHSAGFSSFGDYMVAFHMGISNP